MLFLVNKLSEACGFDGLAGPGSHFYPIVEVAAPCHLFHLYMSTYDEKNDEHLNRHFIATQIKAILKLVADDCTESASIYLQQMCASKVNKGADLDLIKEIYQAKNGSESACLYVTENGEEVFDFLCDLEGKKVQKTLMYRHGEKAD